MLKNRFKNKGGTFILASILFHIAVFMSLPDLREALPENPLKEPALIKLLSINLNNCGDVEDCNKNKCEIPNLSAKEPSKCICKPADEIKRKEFAKEEIPQINNAVQIAGNIENSPQKTIEDEKASDKIAQIPNAKTEYSAGYILHSEEKRNDNFSIDDQAQAKSMDKIDSKESALGSRKKAINLAMLGLEEGNLKNGSNPGGEAQIADNSGGVLEDGDFLDDDMLRYQNFIKNMISENCRRSYPRMARKQGIQGKVWVSFMIAGNGQLKDVKLVGSSSHEILDRAAIKTIHNCSPFKPFPAKTNKNKLWIKMALSYVLE